MCKKSFIMTCFCLITLVIEIKSQNVPSVTFHGSFWDNATGVDLKSVVYAVSGDKKIKLGESNIRGIISLQIPANIQYLIFESKGYESIKQPVHFVGTFARQLKCNFGIRTSVVGIAPPKIITTGIFCVPSTYPKGTQYEIFRAKGRFFITNITALIKANSTAAHEMIPGHYLLVVSNDRGKKLMEKDVFITEGISFVDTHIEEQNSLIIPSIRTTEGVEAKFNNRSLYFAQSSYDLPETTKATLDSVSAYLVSNQGAKISVVGYTDNIGSRNPNVTLSEFRARAVGSYLQKKGIASQRIMVRWQGPDQQIKVTDNSERFKNRRVVIEIIK